MNHNAKERLIAEIATVKELLEVAIDTDDTLGKFTYTSRLEALREEYNTVRLSESSNSGYSAYSDEHDEKHKI